VEARALGPLQVLFSVRPWAAAGSTLTTLGGGLLGAYAGNEIEKANAQELSVALDNGQQVVVIARGDKFTVGQRVKIVLNSANKVVSVEAN